MPRSREILLPWDRQPQEAVEQSDGRVTFWSGSTNSLSQPRDDGTHSSTLGVTTVIGPSGVGRSGWSSGFGSQPYNLPAGSFGSGSSGTIIAVVRIPTGTATANLCHNDVNGMQIRITSGSNLGFIKAGVSVRITASGAVSQGENCVIIGSYGVENRIYKNGALLGVDSANLVTVTNATCRVGSDNSAATAHFGDGVVYDLFAVPWQMSNAEVAELRSPADVYAWAFAPQTIWVPVSAGGPATHATTGALAGAGGAISGTSAHIANHATAGTLAGAGGAIAGSAARTRAHPSSGALSGAGGAVVGASDHVVAGGTHDTSGALQGAGASVVGSAAHIAVHGTSGVLAGSGGSVAGTSARVAAAVSHDTSGALDGGGGAVSGVAIGPDADPVVTAKAGGGFKRHQTRRGYIIKGERYWLTEDELMVLVAQELSDISKRDIKQVTAGKPKAISRKVWDAIKPLERLEALIPVESKQDDDEDEVLMMFV